MARTNAQKRADRLRANAGQQAARRARMSAEGRPDTGVVDLALIEAMAFAVSTLAIDVQSGRPAMAAQDFIGLVTSSAVDILVRRKDHDDRNSRRAIARRLKQRPMHLDPGHIPSLRPDPALQCANAMQTATPPLHPQTMSPAQN